MTVRKRPSAKAEEEADKKHITGSAKRRYVGAVIGRAKREKASKPARKAAKRETYQATRTQYGANNGRIGALEKEARRLDTQAHLTAKDPARSRRYRQQAKEAREEARRLEARNRTIAKKLATARRNAAKEEE